MSDPGTDLPLDDIIERAQRFDGYAYVGGSTDAAQALAVQVRSSWVAGQAEHLPFDDLRAALFAECRMLHHAGDYLTDQHRLYFIALDKLINGEVRTSTPWSKLTQGDDETFVLAEDAPYLEAYNATLPTGSRARIDLTLLPEPWSGDPEAPIIVLALNPGTSPDSPAAHRDPLVRRSVFANLAGHQLEWPLFWLDPALEETAGARWWRKCLRAWLEDFDTQVVARSVVAYEFFGYHSLSAGTIPVTLPSQRWLFDKLRSRLADDPVVVALWGANRWKVAVPELRTYERFYTTKNVQAGTVNPTNLSDEAAAAMRDVLHRRQDDVA